MSNQEFLNRNSRIFYENIKQNMENTDTVKIVGKPSELSNDDDVLVKIRKPKRILHFSDGTMEEYSDDEDEPDEVDNTSKTVVDTSTMTWGPYLIHTAFGTANTVLAACDYVGEGLASFFGITTPKYQFEIDEFKRMQEQNEKEARERAGWIEKKSDEITNHEPTMNPSVANTFV